MGKKVLLIEDEPNIIEAVSFILKRDGWTVATHADGTTALEAIGRHAPDVVILDVMLPGRSGYDILQDLSRFMTKPFSNKEVLACIRELVQA